MEFKLKKSIRTKMPGNLNFRPKGFRVPTSGFKVGGIGGPKPKKLRLGAAAMRGMGAPPKLKIP